MFRTVLVPLDGSMFAEQALPVAIAIARRSRATLRLVRVVLPISADFFWAPLPGGPLDFELREADRQEANAYLDDLVGRLTKAGTMPASFDVVEDVVKEREDISESLAADIARTNADLVVISTHGRGALARVWLGSVADKLVRRLPVPVLLVRPHSTAPSLDSDFQLKHLLVALDGTAAAELIVEPAVAIGKSMDARFTFVRVVPPASHLLHSTHSASAIEAHLRRGAESYLQAVANELRANGLRVETDVRIAGQPAVGILEQASVSGADLIALVTHGRGGINRLLMGSVADKVIRGSSLPVLICRPAA
jgi:nucleotide-binding universal stress UspA family protein